MGNLVDFFRIQEANRGELLRHSIHKQILTSQMPAFLDSHSIGRYTKDDLNKSENLEMSLELGSSIFIMTCTRA